MPLRLTGTHDGAGCAAVKTNSDTWRVCGRGEEDNEEEEDETDPKQGTLTGFVTRTKTKAGAKKGKNKQLLQQADDNSAGSDNDDGWMAGPAATAAAPLPVAKRRHTHFEQRGLHVLVDDLL